MSDGNYYDPKPDLFWRNRYDAAVKLSYEVEADLGRAKKRIAELETELAAAEERGRRRGVEDLQTMLQNAAPHIIGAGHFRLWNCKCGYCAPLQAAIAPRGSGEGEHYDVPCLCGDGSVDPMRCPAHRPGAKVRK